MRKAVLVSAVRTPVGKMGGVFKSLKRTDLSTPVIKEALRRASISGSDVEEIIYGNLPEARTPARYAWLDAGLPVETAGLTIHRACGTSLTGLSLASAFVMGGYGDVYLVGGVEMDSKGAYLVTSTDPYNAGTIKIVPKTSSTEEFGNPSMLQTAENIAKKFGITREECDEYAVRSQNLAALGYEEGLYQEHVIPITVPVKKAEPIVVTRDEILRASTMESLSKLRAVVGGVVTAGNASPTNDGASAGIMMEEEKARSLGLKPLMRFVDYAVVGVDPRYMGLGPVYAMRKLLKRTKMELSDLGFIECNEAFAVQTIAVMRELNIDIDKLNIRGGAIALGHPYTATGVNLAAKAAGLLKRTGVERCAITFCCGGGQGVAAIFENCD